MCLSQVGAAFDGQNTMGHGGKLDWNSPYCRPVIYQSDCESLICGDPPSDPVLLVYVLNYFQAIFLLQNSCNQKHISSRSGP